LNLVEIGLICDNALAAAAAAAGLRET